jgi:hypothetical protein
VFLRLPNRHREHSQRDVLPPHRHIRQVGSITSLLASLTLHVQYSPDRRSISGPNPFGLYGTEHGTQKYGFGIRKKLVREIKKKLQRNL